MIKALIRSTFLGQIAVAKLHEFEGWLLPKLIDDETAVKRYYNKTTSKTLDLTNPITFTEKLNWYKLNDKDPLMSKCADKYAVREYVESKGYEENLNQLYGVYDNPDQIILDTLPDSFVLKATHGSHMNIIVKEKKNLNWSRSKIMMNQWLRQNIYWSGREWVYKDIPRKIIAEQYLEDESGSLRDYKFYCFHGIPRYVDVDSDRFTNHTRNYYDMDWNYLSLTCSFANNDPTAIIDKPEQFEMMTKMATDLSQPFQFVRVDLYEAKGKVYFGELTFFQDGGFPGYSDEWDRRIGGMWCINKGRD